MATDILVVQKQGSLTMDQRVIAFALQGWELIGSPLIVGGASAQVMIKGDRNATNPGYKTLSGLSGDLEQLVSDAINDGWAIYGDPYERAGFVFQAVVSGDIGKQGAQGGGGGPVTPPPVTLRIRHLTSPAYTLTIADRDFMLVFDVAGDVVLTLPAIPGATDDGPFSVLAVNTLGRMDLATAAGETLVAFAPHAEQGATIGLVRGGVKWYATGTNAKVEGA